MGTYIKKIKNNEDTIFPQTVAEAVVFKGGSTLDEVIENLPSGGSGTVTGVKIGSSGELIEPSEGVITLPVYPTVPTNVSAFTNDAGYLTSHQDISGKADKDSTATEGNVAKFDSNGNPIDGGTALSIIVSGAAAGATAYQKPVTGIPGTDIASGVIPDVSSFITKAVDDLTNYYTKSNTYTKTEVEGLIAAIDQFHYEIAASTNVVVSPASNVLYLIGPTGSGSDKYEEYVYPNSTTGWTKIGDTTIDLSGYVQTGAISDMATKTWVGQQGYLTSHQDISGKANVATTLAGYGITDAHITNGVITLGNATITPLTSHQTLPTTLKNPYSLTFGSKTYDGSEAKEITASDLGALTSHQDISGKADKSSTVSSVSYSSGKIQKTINGTTTDVVTATSILADAGGVTNVTAAAGSNIGSVGTPSVSSSTSSGVTTLTFNYLKGETGAAGQNGTNGTNGTDGVSCTHSWSGSTLTVTSASGTSSADLKGPKGDDGAPGTNGTNGTNGTDGVSCTHSWNGSVLTVTSASGSSSADLRGPQGPQGETGATGATGATGEQGPRGYDFQYNWSGTSLGVKNSSESEYSYVNLKGDPGTNGTNGTNGSDGVSCTHSWSGTTLTVTSASGTSSADLKGAPGTNGTNGSNGVSCTHSWNGSILTVTSASGTSSADLRGPQGETGATGATGATGPAGADGLTTSISVNGTTYTQSGGTITLPNYPTVPTTVSSFTNDAGYLTSHQSLAGYAHDTAIVAQSSSNFTAEINKYYDFASAVGTMTVTLPSISNTGYTQGFIMHFTTGSSPALTFTSADSKAIEYYADYSIEASTTYEINCLFNGTKWTVAYAKIG